MAIQVLCDACSDVIADGEFVEVLTTDGEQRVGGQWHRDCLTIGELLPNLGGETHAASRSF